MRTKFEQVVVKLEKEDRVCGLAFHRVKPLILASLRDGKIQVWDYRSGTLIHSYKRHKGRVRGLHFHSSEPLFVAGGDDHTIRVWNFETHHRVVALRGHTDDIRTVQFHHTKPWIVSASDDKTIRIWNLESHTCTYTLTGHHHYVMCASFHPKEDLVVSASLDGTVRVWNLTSLVWSVDLRGVGVHWASFQPSLPLIVSGADDGLVKLWRMNEGTEVLAEVDTLRGHTGAVTSVLFNAKRDLILSRSEDRSICVWDATKRTLIRTFSREGGRFWILAAHPEINLLAASHDKGMVVFKCFERKRPAFALSGGDSLFYAKDGYLCRYEYSTAEDLRVSPISPLSTLHQSPSTISCSPTGNAVLICSDLNGGSYELYPESRDMADAKSGTGGSAVFISHNQFAVLDRDRSTPLFLDGLIIIGKGKVAPDELSAVIKKRIELTLIQTVSDRNSFKLYINNKNIPMGRGRLTGLNRICLIRLSKITRSFKPFHFDRYQEGEVSYQQRILIEYLKGIDSSPGAKEIMNLLQG